MPRGPTPLRPGKRELTKARNRAHLLESARKVFAERDFEGTCVRDIVRASGLSVGTFYEYFRSKEQIFAAVAAEAAAGLRRRLRQVRRDRSFPFEERIHRAYLAYLEFVTEERPLFAVLERQLWQLHDGAQAPGTALAVRELREDLLPDLAPGTGQSEANALAAAMVGSAMLVARQMLSRRDLTPAEAARFCTQFALHGLKGATTSRRRTG
ncbi:MAG TPA: helix-turn-helix domain-containing protein [Myxococcota bacterium]|nr:helix-turn-helix domain-containing protein [Myxococcota bacterium]